MPGPEAIVEQELVRYSEDNNFLCLKVKIEGRRGFPDRMLVSPDGFICFVELKRPGGGKLSPQQIEILKELHRRGVPAIVADNLEDIVDYVDEWGY